MLMLVHQHLLVASSMAAIRHRCPLGLSATRVGPSASICTRTFGAVAFTRRSFGNGFLFKFASTQASHGSLCPLLSVTFRLSTIVVSPRIFLLSMCPSLSCHKL